MGNIKVINQVQKKVLLLALKAGKLMMKSGAEIYRVEDTITRICKACDIPYVDVFAIPTGIFVSLDAGDADSNVYTYVKRIKGSKIDLGKISKINQFAREFTTTDLSIDAGMEIIDNIAKQPLYPLVLRLLGASCVTSFFSMLFGGDMIDFCIAFVLGSGVYAISSLLDKVDTNFFIRCFCCCAVAAFFAKLAWFLLPTVNADAIIIGCLMLFVPGVAITNAIRDFLTGDMLSGLARLCEAVMIALALATGAGVALSLWGLIGGSI